MFTIDKTQFGAFVSALRRERGLTQKELADQLFVSDKAVSKWETGASIPDTALLLPLAECLGVSATELLLCRRTAEAPPDAEETEQAVQAALSYDESRPRRVWQDGSRWPLCYLCAAALGVVLTAVNAKLGELREPLFCAALFSLLFGAYFCLFARTRLPAIYDQLRMGYYVDGPLRLHLPGVAFHNRNWPLILRAGRLWSCLTAVGYPLFSLVMAEVNGALWCRIDGIVFLVFVLGGLFLPIWFAARAWDKSNI